MRIDPYSIEWKLTDWWIRRQIETFRDALERPGLDERKADEYRGYIKALRNTLELPKRINDGTEQLAGFES